MEPNLQTCPTVPLDPLATPGVIRILLSKAASDVLTETGERSFIIVAKVMRGTEEPQTMGRWAITLAPIDWQRSRDAAGVLMGTRKASRLRTPHKAKTPNQ